MILLALIFPPLYFLMNKRTGMALLTGAMFMVSAFLAITVVLLPGSFIMWLVSALCAVWHYRRVELNRNMAQHADMVASKMAEKMRPGQGVPPIIPPKG